MFLYVQFNLDPQCEIAHWTDVDSNAKTPPKLAEDERFIKPLNQWPRLGGPLCCMPDPSGAAK